MGLTVYGYGNFYVMKSNMGLTIQAIYGQCWNTAITGFDPTCFIGLFVQYKTESLSIQFSNNIHNNNIVVNSAYAVNFIKYDIENTHYFITVNDSPSGVYDSESTNIEMGPLMNVRSGKDNNGNPITLSMSYFNINFAASPIHYQQTQGHCNVYDMTPQVLDPNNHMLFNGDTVYLTPFQDSSANAVINNVWAASFAVPKSEDGFVSQKPINYARFRKCTDSPPRVSKRSNIPNILPPITATPAKHIMPHSDAIDLCNEYMGVQDIVFGHLKNLVMSCASDVALTGSIDFITGYSHAASKHLMNYDTDSERNSTRV